MLGDASDIVQRMRAVLPRGWFADNSPNLTAILSSLATPAAWLYSNIRYVAMQARIATASETWLDLVAWDFFGSDVRRRSGESDASLRSRISRALFADAATRPAMTVALTQITGCPPQIFEPARASDTGVYASWPTALGGVLPALAYGSAGGWGSLHMPYQFFVTAKRPSTTGVADLSGYACPDGGYGTGTLAWIDLLNVSESISDITIQEQITRILPVNATAWLRII